MADNKSDTLKVKHVMNGVILHADHHENMLYVTKLLFDNNANAIIVRKDNVPLGIITTRDIVKALIKFDKSPERITAAEIMTHPLVTIDHNSEISDARQVMMDSGLRKLPVKMDFDVIGLLIQDDILKDLTWYKTKK